MDNLTLIKQYAETGAILPEYQLTKLNNNLVKTYLRRRMLQAEEANRYRLQIYEFKMLSREEFIKYAKTVPYIGQQLFEQLDDELRNIIVGAKYQYILKNGVAYGEKGQFANHECFYLSKDQYKKYLEIGGPLSRYMKGIMELHFMEDDNIRQQFLSHKIENDPETLSDYEWLMVSEETFLKHIKTIVNASRISTDDIPRKFQSIYIEHRIRNRYGFTHLDAMVVNSKQQQEFLRFLVDTDIRQVSNNNVHMMSPELRKYYGEKCIAEVGVHNRFLIASEMHRLEPEIFNKFSAKYNKL